MFKWTSEWTGTSRVKCLISFEFGFSQNLRTYLLDVSELSDLYPIVPETYKNSIHSSRILILLRKAMTLIYNTLAPRTAFLRWFLLLVHVGNLWVLTSLAVTFCPAHKWEWALVTEKVWLWAATPRWVKRVWRAAAKEANGCRHQGKTNTWLCVHQHYCTPRCGGWVI